MKGKKRKQKGAVIFDQCLVGQQHFLPDRDVWLTRVFKWPGFQFD
jgi:hypothetical protein